MFKSIDELRLANESIGHHFFDNEWFSKVADSTIYAGRYFITEDFLVIGTIKIPSKYSIRRAEDAGKISTVGLYASYESLKQAIEAVMNKKENSEKPNLQQPS